MGTVLSFFVCTQNIPNKDNYMNIQLEPLTSAGWNLSFTQCM